ncbi:sigma-70 family RNA polymerase sigma factor [Janibacter cremeus]|uniref:RNA polymerase sigma-B factor n=1 Tax=Janibacter cremeus TaxID=1285192 RepID=A0A852VPU8_9MICO|nr:sigma-70 family RNA polymerase sigma factor [Janibacter cremeus]NYF96743.1 RNA polymerase sigma-B factor [Janibacter cremeus]
MSVAPQESTSQVRDRESAELLTQAYAEPDAARASRLRERVVLANRGLADSLARRFEGRGIEADDLHQVAMLGLVQATRRYSPEKGHGFTAFAAPTITGELKRYFRDHGWAVRPPRALQELHQQVRNTSAALGQTHQRAVSDAEVAAELGIGVDEVRAARAAGDRYRSTSLDAPTRALGPVLSETLADGDGEEPYDRVVTLISLRSAMADLDGRERQILKLRFSADLTQQEIGEQVGVSQMQVSRILSSVCRRLRTRIEGWAPTSSSSHQVQVNP